MKIIKITNKVLAGLIMISIFFFLVGITYSYFTASLEGKETGTTITADSGSMKIVYNGGATINAQNIEPSILPFATKVFTITGTNTTNTTETGYKVSLVIDENTFSTDAISYTLTGTNTSGNGIVATNVTKRKNISSGSPLLGKGKFTGKVTNSIHTYELKIYFYETGEDQSINMRKIFKAHINTEELIDYCVKGNCLKDKIIAQGGGTATIEAKGTPDFSVINGTSGLYATTDEYGTSYYYRGLRTELNNNLIFGGFQWKIIRVNGDGSIRVIYNGTCPNDTCTIFSTGDNTNLSAGYTWNDTYSEDTKYVGYMYGGANGIASTIRNGTTSEAATYNETSSSVKVQLDNWYKTNISGKAFENNIVDNIFCNDRQLQNEVGGGSTGPGYGPSTSTNFAALYRLETTKNPTLRCGLKNDRFTVNDTILGNGALTYPVGLITADEAAMSGLVNSTTNTTNYLYTNTLHWTFSPSSIIMTGSANVYFVTSNGEIRSAFVGYSQTRLRPVLNLDFNVMITGIGSQANPYKIVY